MQIISDCTQAEIQKAAKSLKEGHLVAFPTETVYGLGADAINEKAVNRIYSVKKRPADHPLIVHIPAMTQIGKWAIEVPEYALKLAKAYWPGPLTLILKRSDIAKNFITGGQENVGLRVPSHPVAIALLLEFEKLGGLGIAAPSANRFGAVSPTNANAVFEEIGDNLEPEDFILDGGRSLVGIESTIVDCTDGKPSILRPGAITAEMIKEVTEFRISLNKDQTKTRAPGLLDSHYAPKARVILDGLARPGDGFIALKSIKTPSGAIRLASPQDIEKYANEIYAALRLGDSKALKRIVVIPPKGEGLAVAIRNRIERAAFY
jgi:L-threonylcarbamoyladenylate synthase